MCATGVAVIGGSGFIGSHVVAHARSIGVDVTPIAMDRISGPFIPGASTGAAIRDRVEDWRRAHGDAFSRLRIAIEPFAVVINAAGSANPRSTDTGTLFSANVVLPAIVAQAARAAGVRRLIHISTAAVQGRLDPLDETPRYCPLSPYAASKAVGERFLLDTETRQNLPPEVIVYRPASVHGVGQRATRAFARLVTRLPALPVLGRGDRPVPVALVENVAAGILFAAAMPETNPIILQPYEGMTTLSLLKVFGAHRIIHLPVKSANLLIDQLGRLGRDAPVMTTRVRWLELVLRGQQIQAAVLSNAGFHPPAGHESWQELARTVLE